MNQNNELVSLQDTLYNSKNPTRKWLHCTRRDWIIDKIAKYSNSNSKAIEIGPGSGVYLPTLCKHFESVVASDIENVYLNNVEKFKKDFKNLTLTIDDITASSFPENSFDFVLCTEVIEHIADSQKALESIKKILKADGILILSTPQKYSFMELTCKIAFLPIIIDLVRFVYKEPILETGHINLLTEKDIKEQIEIAGFSILDEFKSGLYIPLIAEFMGESGLKLEKKIENMIIDNFLSSTLWTQYYILKA
jgi:ubiquinone/menaquinone biosynthesis C-methylase UbiE